MLSRLRVLATEKKKESKKFKEFKEFGEEELGARIQEGGEARQSPAAKRRLNLAYGEALGMPQ